MLPILLIVSLFFLLILVSMFNPVLSFMLNYIFAAGLALAISGFAFLIKSLAHEKSLDVLGSGMIVVSLYLTATVVALISPTLFFKTSPNLSYQLWVSCHFIEGLALFISAVSIGKKSTLRDVGWIFFPLIGILVLILVYLNLPFINLFMGGNLTTLGVIMLTCGVILLFATIFMAQLNYSQKFLWWAKTLAFAAMLILLGTAISFLFRTNSFLIAFGSLVHFSAYYLIFFSILRNIVLDPLSSIYNDITTERNQYARWDTLSQHLLTFYENISNVRCVEELECEALKPLTLSFNDDFLAFFQITSREEIRYLCAPIYEGYPLRESANLTLLEHQMRAFVSSRSTVEFTLQTFMMDFMGISYRFCICPFIAGADEEGFLIAGRKNTGEDDDLEIERRFYVKFSTMIALSLKNMRLESERIEQEKCALAESNRIAQTLQEAIMPLKHPELDDKHILIAPFLHAAPGLAKIGGDFYDAFVIGDNLVGFTIGDISGHGVDAAAYNAMIRSAIRALGLQNFDPGEVMTATNRHILSELKGSLFATAIFGTLNTTNGLVRLCVAGHPLPLLVSEEGERSYQNIQNPMLGFLENFSYESFEVPLNSNDSIVLYTDGLTEAHNTSGEQFGRERLVNILTTRRGRTPQDTAKRLFNEVEVFCGAREPKDDRAILILRWSQQPFLIDDEKGPLQ